MEKNILAIDIGGSKLIVGVIDNNGNVLDSEKVILPEKYDVDYIIDQI